MIDLYRKKIVIGLLSVVIVGSIARQIEQERQVKKQVWQLEQKKDADGIIRETPKPYFIEKQAGYRYRDPEEITYPSKITGTNRHAMVFLPADYKEEKQYPVLYLLHGLTGSHRTWRNKSADVILQNLHYFEQVPEMIVICPNSAVNVDEDTENLSLPETIRAYDLTGQDLVENLMPYINSHYPVKTGREYTAVAGNSMGGRNTLYMAFTYPELFGYVGVFSSASVLPDETYGHVNPLLKDLVPPAEKFRLLMLSVGRSDDVCGDVTYKLHGLMKEKGIEHLFYDTEGGHEDTVWQNALYNFAKKLFI